MLFPFKLTCKPPYGKSSYKIVAVHLKYDTHKYSTSRYNVILIYIAEIAPDIYTIVKLNTKSNHYNIIK